LDIPECIKELQEIFLETYPLFMRRWKLFSSRQKEGEDFTRWYTKLKVQKCEANLENMKSDEFWLMLIMCLTSDQQLLNKFLKLKNLNEEALTNEARSYENANTCRKEIAWEGKQRLHKAREDRTPLPGRNPNPRKFEGHCFKCNKQGH
jgi:hypothetical protein